MVSDASDKPYGICFSPDYKKLYVCDRGEPRNVQVFDVADNKLRNQKLFTDMKLGERSGLADGIRPDVDGNIWAGANGGAGGAGGHRFFPPRARLSVITPPGKIAQIFFSGPKRQPLFLP